MASLLLVCTANLCRSPMAEALFRAHQAQRYSVIASAGLRAHPKGEPVDARAAAALARHGYSLPKRWRSQRVNAELLQQFSTVLAMEARHVKALRELCPTHPNIQLLLDTLPGHQGQDVADPYFSTTQGFDAVMALLQAAARQGR